MLLTTRCLTMVALIITVSAIVCAGEQVFTIDAGDWSRAKHGERVADLKPLRKAVRTWMASSSGQLFVVYPETEKGEFWAQELVDWLVALGIPSQHIEIRAINPTETHIKILIVESSKVRP